jgi:2-haloacid dehalogenase
MYKYILWDIDGTVLDFHKAEHLAINALFEKYKIGVCTDEMLSLYKEINIKYWQRLERNELTKNEILVCRFRDFFEKIGVDSKIAGSFNDDYQLALGDYIIYVDNAKEILLSQKGKYVLAAVTNGTKIAQEKKLSLSGLDKLFDEIFISECIGIEKPNQGFFDFVFDKLQITDKKEAIIIGDSLTSDIKGGINAGIDTCWFNPSQKSAPTDMDITFNISDLSEIEKIVFD